MSKKKEERSLTFEIRGIQSVIYSDLKKNSVIYSRLYINMRGEKDSLK